MYDRQNPEIISIPCGEIGSIRLYTGIPFDDIFQFLVVRLGGVGAHKL